MKKITIEVVFPQICGILIERECWRKIKILLEYRTVVGYDGYLSGH